MASRCGLLFNARAILARNISPNLYPEDIDFTDIFKVNNAASTKNLAQRRVQKSPKFADKHMYLEDFISRY